jgi:hypothetical protein
MNLDGKGGLSETDARWSDITEPDETGFRGLTSFASLKIYRACEKAYHPEALLRTIAGEWENLASAVVCFESSEMQEGGKVLHSAVAKTSNGYLLPPLTLLEVVDVQEERFEYLPGKWIQQKLIVVRPTFLLPAKKQLGQDDDEESAPAGSSKFAGDRAFLHYGNTGDAVRGLEDITDEPPLTMRQEWARNDSWVDWQGKPFSAWTEYLYVAGTVNLSASQARSGSGVGGRDDGHDGYSPETFMQLINEHLMGEAG